MSRVRAIRPASRPRRPKSRPRSTRLDAGPPGRRKSARPCSAGWTSECPACREFRAADRAGPVVWASHRRARHVLDGHDPLVVLLAILEDADRLGAASTDDRRDAPADTSRPVNTQGSRGAGPLDALARRAKSESPLPGRARRIGPRGRRDRGLRTRGPGLPEAALAETALAETALAGAAAPDRPVRAVWRRAHAFQHQSSPQAPFAVRSPAGPGETAWETARGSRRR